MKVDTLNNNKLKEIKEINEKKRKTQLQEGRRVEGGEGEERRGDERRGDERRGDERRGERGIEK
jgi:hypothetical protein